MACIGVSMKIKPGQLWSYNDPDKKIPVGTPILILKEFPSQPDAWIIMIQGKTDIWWSSSILTHTLLLEDS